MTELKKSGRYYPYIMRDSFTIAGILFLLWIFLQLHEIEYENLNLGVNICNFVAGFVCHIIACISCYGSDC